MGLSHMGRLALMTAVVFVFAGCGGTGSTSAVPSGAMTQSRAHQMSGLLFATKSSDPWLYVSGNANNTVAIYDLSKSGSPEVGTITDGVSSPGGVAVDKAGQVYVSNETGTVTIYPAGKTSPSLTLSDDLSQPESVTVDSNENVYVCERGNSPAIVVFPPGETTPSEVITNDLIQVPSQIQFDPTGDLYYTDDNTGVSEIPEGSRNMTSLHLQGLQRTDGIALDKRGNLYIGTFGNDLDGVREYVIDDQSPIRTLKDSKGADFNASGVLGKTDYIFLPESYNNTVKAFKLGRTKPAFVVDATAAQYSVGVALKPAGVP
jgi:hypothetical protein